MDSPLSQLDISSPDHVSVITKNGRVTISITKDGSSVTLGFPIANQSSRIELQQTKPLVEQKPRPKYHTNTKHIRYTGPTPKLTVSEVKEIKMMVDDPGFMKNFGSVTKAYEEIGKAYKVTGCAVSNIARRVSWKHVEPDELDKAIANANALSAKRSGAI